MTPGAPGGEASSRPAGRRSYSVPLRPDIALVVPSGPNAGLHLLDAKFRLDRLDAALVATDAAEESEENEAAERRGTFKRADLYKMHTYRDAIPDARSAWILYPGTETRFFDDTLPGAWSTTPEGAAMRIWSGVGAFPLVPEETPGVRRGPLLSSLLAS